VAIDARGDSSFTRVVIVVYLKGRERREGLGLWWWIFRQFGVRILPLHIVDVI